MPILQLIDLISCTDKSYIKINLQYDLYLMLVLKPICENCEKELPYNSSEAMICTFECTFCADCVKDVLQNVCPNCGGGFEKRPVRPQQALIKFPAKTERYSKPIDSIKFDALLRKNKDIDPCDR